MPWVEISQGEGFVSKSQGWTGVGQLWLLQVDCGEKDCSRSVFSLMLISVQIFKDQESLYRRHSRFHLIFSTQA